MGDKHTQQRLEQAYERMLERVRDMTSGLQQRIDAARDKAVELGELTREEADRIGDYLRRDLRDAAGHLAETGQELADWLNFDLELVEDRLADLLSVMVDHTRMELDALAERAHQASRITSGEIAAPGTLRCRHCGQILHLHRTSQVPRCSKCHKTEFERESRRPDG